MYVLYLKKKHYFLNNFRSDTCQIARNFNFNKFYCRMTMHYSLDEGSLKNLFLVRNLLGNPSTKFHFS